MEKLFSKQNSMNSIHFIQKENLKSKKLTIKMIRKNFAKLDLKELRNFVLQKMAQLSLVCIRFFSSGPNAMIFVLSLNLS